MKSKKLFKFLSVLLCSSMLFSVGCGSSSNLPVEEGNKAGENLSYYVDAQFKSEYSSYLYANEIKGEYVDGFQEGLVVFKNIDKDLMNNIVETYSVYNANLDNLVLTFENKYEDLYLGNYDKYDNTYLQFSKKSVNVKSESAISYIEVITETNTKIDDALIEDYEDHNFEGLNGANRYKGNGYEKTYTYDYYDASGKLITSSNLPIEVEGEGRTDEVAKVSFGKINATFNRETSELIEVWDSTKEDKRVLYDCVNEFYGYYLEAPYGSYGALEVYSLKTGELIYRYVYNGEAISNVLSNGEVLIQTATTKLLNLNLDDPEMDVNFETYVFNPDQVSIRKVETDYFFQDVVTGKELAKEEDSIYTDKVLNMGVVVKKSEFTNLFEEPESKVVFFNSNLEITFEVASLYTEQVAFADADDFEASIDRLASGDYLVSIKTAVPGTDSKAIIKADGTLRSYVPMGATVLEKVIVTNNGVYDFDLKLLKKFNTGDSLYTTIGNAIVVKRYVDGISDTYYVVTESQYTYVDIYDKLNSDDNYIYNQSNTFERVIDKGNGFYIGVSKTTTAYGTEFEYKLYYHNGNLIVDDCDTNAVIKRFGDNYIFGYDSVNAKIYKITDKSVA